jgi:hypothetical protein
MSHGVFLLLLAGKSEDINLLAMPLRSSCATQFLERFPKSHFCDCCLMHNSLETTRVEEEDKLALHQV